MDMLANIDQKFLEIAYQEALAGFEEGGCPIGSSLAEGGRLIARGRNQRVQKGDPIAHGEMDCLRNAGRQKSYRQISRILFEDYGLANDKGKPSNPKTIMVMVSQ